MLFFCPHSDANVLLLLLLLDYNLLIQSVLSQNVS